MSVEYKYFRVAQQIANDFDAAVLDEISESHCFEMGKSWQAVHFALTGSREETDELLSKAIFGDELVLVSGVTFALVNRVVAKEVFDALSNLDMVMARNRLEQDHSDNLYSFDYDNLDDAIEETLSQIELFTSFYKDADKHGEIVLVKSV